MMSLGAARTSVSAIRRNESHLP